MLKKYTEYTIKAKFYLTADKSPEKTIEEIMKGIADLGGNPEIIGNKLVKEIPK